MTEELRNSEIVYLTIKTLFGEEPEKDFTRLDEDIDLTGLGLMNLFSNYSQGLQAFLVRGRQGILDLALLAKEISSERWGYHAGVLTIEDSCGIYGLDSRIVRRNIRKAFRLAEDYLDIGYVSRTVDEVFYRLLANILVAGKYRYGNRAVVQTIMTFEQYFHVDAICTKNDLLCYVFSVDFVLSHTTGQNEQSLTKYMKDYCVGYPITGQLLAGFCGRQVNFSQVYYNASKPSKVLQRIIRETLEIFPVTTKMCVREAVG